MSNFTVSARKYRPGTFENVVGQQHVTLTLKNAIRKDHLGHAFLFCGPRGVGKTTCARILAKSLNCENLSAEGEPCGQCNSCLSFASQQSFNIYELDAASNNSVDDIRSLTEQVRFAPQSGRYKIYIIDEVHMLSQAAFNAFLKTLEEPPSYAIFILATTEKHKIIPTILSRCQVFDFHRITIKQAIDHLKAICQKEKIEAEEEALYVIAQKADGAMRDALSIFDRVVSFSGDKLSYQDVISNLNVLDYEYYFRIVDHFLRKDLSQSLLLFNEILENGFDSHNFLVGLSEHLRNLLVCKDPSTIPLLDLTEGTQSRYMDQSARTPLSFILSGLNILNQFDVNYKAAKNQRLHVELSLMKLSHLPDVLEISSNGNGHAHTEKKKPEPSGLISASSQSVSTPVKAQATVVEKPKKLRLEEIRNQVASQSKVNTPIAENDEIIFQNADPALFSKAWKDFADRMKSQDSISMYSLASLSELEFTPEGSVVIKVKNEGLKSIFNNRRQEIVDYLQQCHITGIRMECVFEAPTDEELKRYVVTDADKFRRMSELNPALNEMQNRLGLRLEY